MEGFLQRSVSMPNWSQPSFTPGIERYRLRYWINRLPTFVELKRRGDRRDDSCLRCFESSENQTHCVVGCSANTPSLHKFRIKILRKMRSYLNILPTRISATEARSLLIRRHIPCPVVNGWSLTTYDNHDRSKVLLQGERLIQIEQLTHIPARVHHILSQTLATEDTLNALYTPFFPRTQ